MKPSPHFADLNSIICVIGRVYDRGRWTFIDRSGPTANIRMASPPSSSQCSNITNFSTSDKSESELGSASGSSPMLWSSSTSGSPMDLDAFPADSSG